MSHNHVPVLGFMFYSLACLYYLASRWPGSKPPNHYHRTKHTTLRCSSCSNRFAPCDFQGRPRFADARKRRKFSGASLEACAFAASAFGVSPGLAPATAGSVADATIQRARRWGRRAPGSRAACESQF